MSRKWKSKTKYLHRNSPSPRKRNIYSAQRDRSPDYATRHPDLPALRQWLTGCEDKRRLQLRGSSGFSPLSRASRCHLQRHRLQRPPPDDFKKITPTALRLSQRNRNAQDGHLAGLLTYASANSSAFPVRSQWHCARLLALTVAGQWRILTALPDTRWEELYRRRSVRSRGRVVFGF